MPKFNADEQVFEPIELVLEGKTYVVKEVKQGMFDEIKRIADEAMKKIKKGEEDINVVFKQLGLILSTDPKELEGIDVRKASAALRYLSEEIRNQVSGEKAKNDSREG